MQIVQARLVSDGDVVDLVGCIGARARRRQQVGLHRVVDEAEVAAGFAVSVDANALAAQHRRGPLRNHGGIGAIGILPRSEDVEVAQPDRLQPVAPGKHLRVQLVDVLGDGVRRQRPADHVFHFRQSGMIAVG